MLSGNNEKRIIITKQNNQNPPAEIADNRNTREILLEICDAIVEGGYNPVSQIVGYIISEDPTHIANYKNARTLISKIDRDDLLEDMVKYYIRHIEKVLDKKDDEQ